MNEIVNQQNEFYSKIYETSSDNMKLIMENKRLKAQLYEYRLEAYNELSNNECSSSSTSDLDSSYEDSHHNLSITKRKVTRKRPKQTKTKETHTSSTYESNTEQRNNSYTPPLVEEKKNRKAKLTVLGDSMIRGTGSIIADSVNDYNTCVLSKSGCTINDASSSIRDILKDDYQKGDVVVLSIGTNNVEVNNHVQITNKFSQLIETTKLAAHVPVIITALPSRISPGSSSLNKKIDNINKSLRFMCEQSKNLSFVDCNPEILLNSYKNDGLHFSPAGVKHFASTLSAFINSNFHMSATQHIA